MLLYVDCVSKRKIGCFSFEIVSASIIVIVIVIVIVHITAVEIARTRLFFASTEVEASVVVA